MRKISDNLEELLPDDNDDYDFPDGANVIEISPDDPDWIDLPLRTERDFRVLRYKRRSREAQLPRPLLAMKRVGRF